MDAEIGADEQSNTSDQNHLHGKMKMHFKNDPKSGVIEYHVKDMAWDDGKHLLTRLMHDSFDAVARSTTATGSINNPKDFLLAFANNLQQRLIQNQVAIELDMFEFQEFTVGSGGRQAMRTPLQLTLKRTSDGQWRKENIVGPSLIQEAPKDPNVTVPTVAPPPTPQ